MTDTRVCRKCDKELPKTEFKTRDKRFTKDGLGFYCIECQREYDRARYLKKREDVIIRARNWYKNNHCRHRDRVLRTNYGIGIDEYNAILESQAFGCAICGKDKEKNRTNLAVDHCHKTMRVRGLLCESCNKGLGLFMDNPEILLRAVEYLRRDIDEKINND